MATASTRKKRQREAVNKPPCEKPEETAEELSPERKVARLLVNRHLDAIERLARR